MCCHCLLGQVYSPIRPTAHLPDFRCRSWKHMPKIAIHIHWVTHSLLQKYWQRSFQLSGTVWRTSRHPRTWAVEQCVVCRRCLIKTGCPPKYTLWISINFSGLSLKRKKYQSSYQMLKCVFIFLGNTLYFLDNKMNLRRTCISDMLGCQLVYFLFCIVMVSKYSE